MSRGTSSVCGLAGQEYTPVHMFAIASTANNRDLPDERAAPPDREDHNCIAQPPSKLQ